MKIAATYENGQIFQHFGQTQSFKVYEIEDGKVVNATVIGTGDSGHCALADFLFNGGIEALICGGIGGGAKNALAQAGIQLFAGVSGSADQAVEDLLANQLIFNPEYECTAHDHNEGDCHGHSH